MENKKYWKLNQTEQEAENVRESTKIEHECERYYFWQYCRIYGWRQLGATNGYRTLEELKNCQSFSIKSKDNIYPFRITKSTIIK